jgi:hypothetical protein
VTIRESLRGAGIVALVIWLVAATVLGGILLLRHLVPLPLPDTNDSTTRQALRQILPAPTWRAFHVMYRTCPCSQRTIKHLLDAPRPADLRELVIVVDDDGHGDPEDDQLRRGGFGVEVITPTMLHDNYHLEAAPVLVVMSPDDEVVYMGGYNRHKQSAAYEDVAIITDLRAHRATEPLPVFGCAISERLARLIDPLNLAR